MIKPRKPKKTERGKSFFFKKFWKSGLLLTFCHYLSKIFLYGCKTALTYLAQQPKLFFLVQTQAINQMLLWLFYEYRGSSLQIWPSSSAHLLRSSSPFSSFSYVFPPRFVLFRPLPNSNCRQMLQVPCPLPLTWLLEDPMLVSMMVELSDMEELTLVSQILPSVHQPGNLLDGESPHSGLHQQYHICVNAVGSRLLVRNQPTPNREKPCFLQMNKKRKDKHSISHGFLQKYVFVHQALTY